MAFHQKTKTKQKQKKHTERELNQVCACQLNTTLLVFLFFLLPGTLVPGLVLCPSVLLSYPAGRVPAYCRSYRSAVGTAGLPEGYAAAGEGGGAGYHSLLGCQAGAAVPDLNDPSVTCGADAAVSAFVQGK